MQVPARLRGPPAAQAGPWGRWELFVCSSPRAPAVSHGWRWGLMIESSLTRRSPAADGPRASRLKRLTALPIARQAM